PDQIRRHTARRSSDRGCDGSHGGTRARVSTSAARRPTDVAGVDATAAAGDGLSAGRGSRFRLALHPELRLARPVVCALDVPILTQRVVVHRRDEVEGRLELDVVETGIGRDQLMLFTREDEHESSGTYWQTSGIVLHFAGARLDEIEMLWNDRPGLRRMVHVTR